MCNHCAHRAEMAKIWAKSDIEHRYAMMQGHMDMVVADMLLNSEDTPEMLEQMEMSAMAIRMSQMVAANYYGATDEEIAEVITHALAIEGAYGESHN